jgi:hypothetical protein
MLNKKGFTFASVMIAAGLLSGLTLAIIQISKNIGFIQSIMKISSDENELTSTIRLIVNNPQHCQASFKGISFKKSEIDFSGKDVVGAPNYTQANEGKNIDLWLSNQNLEKGQKKFNGADNVQGENKSLFGAIKIDSIKLVMNNGLGECSDDYCPGLNSDMAQLVLLIEKKMSSVKTVKMKKVFHLNLVFNTDSSGVSTVKSCVSEESKPRMASGQDISGPDLKTNGFTVDLENYGFNLAGSDPHIMVTQRKTKGGNLSDCGFTKLSKLQFKITCKTKAKMAKQWAQSSADWVAIQI